MKLQPFYNLQYKKFNFITQDIWNYPLIKPYKITLKLNLFLINMLNYLKISYLYQV